MSQTRATDAREKLLKAGTELFRRCGYVATTVDEICARAGVTKGAFFHHFASKEALAETCLRQWNCQGAAMDEAAPFQALDDPLEKVLGCMDYYYSLFTNPKILKSCLAGTTVQEIAETHPALREAAQACFVNLENRFKALLDEACRSERKSLDTASLATFWLAAVQGSLLLAKASRDESVIRDSLGHVKEYIKTLFAGRSGR
jgi:TetR/AcrR family transcriptional repressor of nem operon